MEFRSTTWPRRAVPALLAAALTCAVVLATLAPAAHAAVRRGDRVAPTTPTKVRAVGTATTQVTVTWRASRDNVGVRAYLVYRNGRTLPVAVVRGNVLALRDRLAPSTAVHRYVVRARDATGNLSRPSAVVRASTLAVPAPPAPNPTTSTGGGATPATPGELKPATIFGYSTHFAAQSDPDAYVDLALRGGAAAIRDDVAWADVEPEQGVYDWRATDSLMRTASKRGLQVLLMVGTTPRWASTPTSPRWVPPTDPATYAAFVAEVAARYRPGGAFWVQNPDVAHTPLLGIQVWNEPNLDRFWRVGPDPVVYSRLLRSAYAAAKAVDPALPVVSGGLAPLGGVDDVDCNGVVDIGAGASGWNPVNYLVAMYANGVQGSFDALGWQPYEFGPGASADAMTATTPCSAWTQMSETPVSARSLMVAHGDGGKRIWATELGAPTCIAGATYICTSDDQIAIVAERRVAAWRTFPWAGGFFWYDVRDDEGGDSTTDHEEHFGAVTAAGVPKPTFAALLRAWTTG